MNRILIIGGSSSFGRGFAEYLSKNKIFDQELIIYSRDETKQQEMKGFCKSKSIPATFSIGDIRDQYRLKEVMTIRSPNVVIIAAAMKHIDLCEANPMEAVKTNILGVQNVIDICKQTPSVKICIFLSADKAIQPAGIYGYTKAIGESLISDAQISHAQGSCLCSFISIRYSNVLGSRGSVIQTFQEILNKGETIKVFGSDMQRMVITQEEVAHMVWYAINNSDDLIYCRVLLQRSPKIYIKDLAQAMVELIGKGSFEVIDAKRDGEKEDALLYTKDESKNLCPLPHCHGYTINFQSFPMVPVESYGTHNAKVLTVDEIKEMVKPLLILN